jgi:upstream activation factor subunit UAF30
VVNDAPASAPAATTAPAPKKAGKKAAAAAAASAAQSAEVAVAVPSSEVVVSASEVVAEVVAAPSEFTDFMSKLQQLSNLVNSLKSEFRTLEKKANKDLKTVAKANAKRHRKNVNRAPSGFVKPTLISAELASFLGKTVGTEMARTEVTREINTYIREHQLQDKSNGRIINADTKLSSLLKIPAGEELTYFNLQRYMSPHFTKTAQVVTA